MMPTIRHTRPAILGVTRVCRSMRVGALLLVASCSLLSVAPVCADFTVPLSFLSTNSVASPITGAPYALQFSAQGGLPPYHWSLSSVLPAGLRLSASGLVSGTPTATGAFSYGVTVTDSKGATGGGTASGTISAMGTVPFDIALPQLSLYGLNEDLGFQPFVEGGTPPYAFTVTGLPAGVTYDPGTGTLTGSPTTAGTFQVAFALKDSTGNAATGTPVTVPLTVERPVCSGGGGGSGSGGSASSGSGGGSSGGGSGGGGTPQCLAPQAQLSINVTAQECSACTRLFIVAESPQITAAIMAGKSPCSQLPPGNFSTPGCMVSGIWVSTFADCGGSSCGPYTWNLADDFAPALSGAAPPITDSVELCPFNCADASCSGAATPAGACVTSSTNDLCDPNATITVIINGTAAP